MKCEQCGKDYQAKRADSKYCSNACRVSSQRLSGTKIAGTKPNPRKKVSLDTLKVSSPEETKKVEYSKAEQMLLDDGPEGYSEADKYATQQYLKHGYFGGKANKVKGAVSSISYFNYQGARNAHKSV